MTLSQWEHPEAIAEFDAAVRWYEEQKQGGLFIAAVNLP